MLVYANHLGVFGENPSQILFEQVARWLREQLGFRIRIDQLKRDNHFEGRHRTWLRSRVTTQDEPRLYSWVLTRLDDQVAGRQWIAELGMKDSHKTAEISCVLRTDDQSILISESNQVKASQPRLIPYVVDGVSKSLNCDFVSGTPGIQIKQVGADFDSYRGLLASVERPERDFPLVLVSPKDHELYLVNPQKLQEKLLGLAQVVRIAPQYDSYLMAETLGKHWSAWDGALNVIQPRNRTGFIRGMLFRSDEIEAWGNHDDRYSRVLTIVAHNTNIPRLRLRIRPDGVTRLANRREMEEAVAQSEAMSANELRKLLIRNAEMAKENDEFVSEFEPMNRRLNDDLNDVKAELRDTKNRLRKTQYDLSRLVSRRTERSDVVELDTNPNLEKMFNIACESPTPLECLDALEQVHSDKCVILASARASAEQMGNFRHGTRLLNLLKRLVTTYREHRLTDGDTKARKCFTRKEFAARESEQVTNNAELRQQRIFAYRGNDMEMFSHLKIGVSEGSDTTLRVHFGWDAERSLIVIGHCGTHLKLLNR